MKMQEAPAPARLQKLIEGLRPKHYPRGQILLYQGDVPLDTLILKKGVIKLHDIDDNGNEKILHLVKPYSVIPLAFFSGNKSHMHWFYTALTDCDVCVLPAEDLERQMKEDSALAIYLMNWFSLEVHELLVRLNSFGKTTAFGKISAAIKFLATHHYVKRRSGWRRIDFPVNQQMLADMTGLTRESVASILRDFRKKEVIRNPRQTIMEVNLDALERLSQAA